MGDFLGGGGEAAGPISEKGLINAYKRAKQSGVFLVSGQQLSVFPSELCKFQDYKPPDDSQDWWDSHQLSRIDVSNNLIAAIPSEINIQQTLAHLNFAGNKIQELPDQIFELENLKFLDISNN